MQSAGGINIEIYAVCAEMLDVHISLQKHIYHHLQPLKLDRIEILVITLDYWFGLFMFILGF